MIPGLELAREVAVIGLGRSGAAATRLLRSAGAIVYASDGGQSESLEATASELRALGADVETGGHDLDRIGRAGLAVLSPGVPPDAPPVVAARSHEVPVWAEAELGLRALHPAEYAAITGTNGKTTTTALVGHLLVAAGRRARTAGNIGTPLSQLALSDDRPDVLAVELSSFQLHDMPSLAPSVGVLTNLAPDHLDRYATLDEYYRDKMRLFLNATLESRWITNADDETSARWVGDMPGRRYQFSLIGPADAWYDRAANLLRLGEAALLDRDRLPLLGDHNVANALAAALAVAALGVPIEVIGQGLETVAALPHRMEPVSETGGVLWINDSKATNLSSTDVAVRAMARPYILLLGGRHKGESYARLAPLLTGCRAVIAYGEAKPIILRDLSGAVRLVEGGTFAEVVAAARSLARVGDAVLLSPACSSYDMFPNYEVRGATFRHLVEAM
ncbi:MAG: UDP-N-acetylmuramoyl-L-alanine--D-glutamate ligase [Gemmatimonadales bacterium]|nr:UDP-N-acetylmuramoyl-L-alanine--D-glutamate ligase [Gemmatimonadales bacterium]